MPAESMPIKLPEHFRLIAHRGASAYAPENTMAAFELAWDLGAREFETDVQLTTDGVVVLCHDSTLARYGHGTLAPEQMAWDQLAGLDMGSWFASGFAGERLVRLEELLARFGADVVYHLELKGDAEELPDWTAALVRAAGLEQRCFVTSFSERQLAASLRVAPELLRGWLVSSVDQQVLTRAVALEVHQLCIPASLADEATVRLARRVAREVRAWGLGSDPELAAYLLVRVLEAGCDGVTTDWPDWPVAERR